MMFKHFIKHCWSMALATVLIVAGNRTALAEVNATIEVPNGTVENYGLIKWNLNDPGELPVSFEVEIAPGMDAYDIAYVMALETDETNGIQAYNDGDTFIAWDVCGSLEMSPSEVEIDWQVDCPPGNPVPHPDFPLVYQLRPVFPVVGLYIGGGRDGDPVRFNEDLILDLEITFDRVMVKELIPVWRGDSTEDVVRAIDKLFSKRSLPSEVQYDGIVRGLPTFSAPEGARSCSTRLSTGSRRKSDVRIGYCYHDGR